MLRISITTFNRKAILYRMLLAVERYTREPHVVLITDNASTDGTPAMLREYAAERDNVQLWLLPHNVGIAKARNAHWEQCVGFDTVRLDDKVQVQSPHWSQIMRAQAEAAHSLVAFTDPDTEKLWRDPTAYKHETVTVPDWKCGAGMFILGEASKAVGAWCEDYGEYGHEDLDYMDRAEGLGWKFCYSMRVRAQHLARASAGRRAGVEPYVAAYQANKKAYADGEKDIALPIEKTDGWRLGQEHRDNDSGLVAVGTAGDLSYP